MAGVISRHARNSVSGAHVVVYLVLGPNARSCLSPDVGPVMFGVAFYIFKTHPPQNPAPQRSLGTVRRNTSQSDQTGKYFLLTLWERSRLRCGDAVSYNETYGAAHSC